MSALQTFPLSGATRFCGTDFLLHQLVAPESGRCQPCRLTEGSKRKKRTQLAPCPHKYISFRRVKSLHRHRLGRVPKAALSCFFLFLGQLCLCPFDTFFDKGINKLDDKHTDKSVDDANNCAGNNICAVVNLNINS